MARPARRQRHFWLHIILDGIQMFLFSFISHFISAAHPCRFCLLIWVILIGKGLIVKLVVSQIGREVHFLLLLWLFIEIIWFDVFVILNYFRTWTVIWFVLLMEWVLLSFLFRFVILDTLGIIGEARVFRLKFQIYRGLWANDLVGCSDTLWEIRQTGAGRVRCLVDL